MFTLKTLLALLLSSQLSTNVVADLSDDARNALDLLNGQIYSSARLISIAGGNLWYAYTRDLPEVAANLTRNETVKFNIVLSNLIIIANNVVGGDECVDTLNNTMITIVNHAIAEDLMYSYLARRAFQEVQNTQYQYWDLHTDWFMNCIENQGNCDGTSRAIIAEVERLLPKLRRTPYEFFSEIHVLAYKVDINLESVRKDIRHSYNKAVETAAICIASKLAQAQGNIKSVRDTPRDVNASVSQSYQDLVDIVQKANATAYDNINDHARTITFQYINDVQDDLSELSLVYFKANNTIHSVMGEAQNLNATIICNLPDLDVIYDSTLRRIFEDSNPLLFHIMKAQVDKAIDKINSTAREIYSIGIEIDGCSEDADCDHILEKIASKRSEIPQRIQMIEQSSWVRFQQTTVAQRESAARAVRDAIEQAEVEILEVKSCFQFGLQYINAN